jgi:hypothetical protein
MSKTRVAVKNEITLNLMYAYAERQNNRVVGAYIWLLRCKQGKMPNMCMFGLRDSVIRGLHKIDRFAFFTDRQIL